MSKRTKDIILAIAIIGITILFLAIGFHMISNMKHDPNWIWLFM